MSSNRTLGGRVSVVLMTMVFSALSVSRLLAEEETLNLNDFDCALGEIRSRVSVEREKPTCRTLQDDGKNVEFRSEGKPFNTVGLILRAKRDGTVTLLPEFFLVRDGLQYGICHGIRFVKPAPDPHAEAFHPPNNAGSWPGHAGNGLYCKKGETVVIELLFDHIVQEDFEVMMTVPRVRLQKHSPNTKDAQPESGHVRK